MEREGKGAHRLLTVLGRYKYVFLVAVLGVLLMAVPSRTTAADTPRDVQLPAQELEAELRQILGKIHGVGRVEVMLTLQSGPEEVLASDTSLQYRGQTASPEDYQRTTKTVTVPGGSGVVVTQRRYPQYRGALVVCDGGGEDKVRLQVIEAVSALTGLGADRIAVVRYGSGEANK